MSNCAISSRRSSQLLRKTYMKLLVPLIMLTLFIVNPSWLVGWELRSVFEQTRRMIRVTWSCKGLGGWKHIVNGHLLVTTRVGHLMIVSRHAAWVCSERVGGAVDLRRESARRRRESTRWGGGKEWSPRSSVLTILSATDASAECSGWPQKHSYLQGAADPCRRPSPSTREDFCCLLPCWFSCLAFSSPS